jgi:hypothetical protein
MSSDDPHLQDVPDQPLIDRAKQVDQVAAAELAQVSTGREPVTSQPSTSPEPAAKRSIGIDRSQIREGAEVVGSDGERLGQVKQVRDNDFLLDRPMKRDLFVPLSVVALAGVDRIVLELSADEVGERNWPESTLM